MRTVGYLLFVTIAATILLPLAVSMVRFNLKRRAIIRSVRAASGAQLDAVYRIIEAAAAGDPGACLLVRSNETASSNENAIALPAGLSKFPWAGKRLKIEGALRDVPAIAVVDATDEGRSALGGKLFRPLRLPARRGKSGKSARNIYASSALLRMLPDLQPALSDICPQYPADTLTYLLGSGSESYEYEPIDQCRIASGIAWIQEPEVPRCADCVAPPAFIVQIPGMMLSPRLGEGNFYIFGCRTHVTNLMCVTQFF